MFCFSMSRKIVSFFLFFCILAENLYGIYFSFYFLISPFPFLPSSPQEISSAGFELRLISSSVEISYGIFSLPILSPFLVDELETRKNKACKSRRKCLKILCFPEKKKTHTHKSQRRGCCWRDRVRKGKKMKLIQTLNLYIWVYKTRCKFVLVFLERMAGLRPLPTSTSAVHPSPSRFVWRAYILQNVKPGSPWTLFVPRSPTLIFFFSLSFVCALINMVGGIATCLCVRAFVWILFRGAIIHDGQARLP